MLAASGIPPGRALRDLKALNPHASITPSKEQDTFDPDNQKFLKSIQQRGRQVMISEGLARTQRDFDVFLEDKVNMDWEVQRRRIFQHFGLAQKADEGNTLGATARGSFGRSAKQSKQFGATPPHGPSSASRRSVFGKSGLEKSVIGTPGTGLAFSSLFESQADRGDGPILQTPDFRFLHEKMGHYAEKVQLLNAARLRDRTFPILHEFSEVEKRAGGDVSRIFLVLVVFIAHRIRSPHNSSTRTKRWCASSRRVTTSWTHRMLVL